MRKSIPASKRFEVRRLVEECEALVEVSELEKILSQLAYLMKLYIDDCDQIRVDLGQAIGAQAASFRELGTEKVGSIRQIASANALPKSPRVLFWMWRSWLLQQEFEALNEVEVALLIEREKTNALNRIGKLEDLASMESDPSRKAHYADVIERLQTRNPYETATTGEGARLKSPAISSLRLEWTELDATVQEAKNQLSRHLERLPEELAHLRDLADEARFAIDAYGGSPQAALMAARKLLRQAEYEIRALERQVAGACGFGGQHRPSVKFDKHTARNARAYYKWKHHDDLELAQEFVRRSDGSSRSPQQARNAAVKEASRFEARLADYDRVLESIEDVGQMPTVFFARRIGQALDDAEQRRGDA